jgi:membrane fusion protein, heavy metal efflux system
MPAGAPSAPGMRAIAWALVVLGCRSPERAKPADPPQGEVWLLQSEVERAGVATAPVEEHSVDDVLVTNGRVAFDEARVAHVLSPLSGRVVVIAADLGAHVRKGDPLVFIESPDLGAATADLNKSTAALIAAEHAYERLKELQQANAASEAALEQAEDAWRTARAERERAEQKVRLLHAGRTVTQLYPLTSPIEGDVLARNVTPGLNLQGAYSGGAALELFTVGDVENVWVLADVYEADLARVRSGAHVDVNVIGLEQTFQGSVDWISNILDPQTRTARLRCAIPNPQSLLKPEMYGTVRVSATPIPALAIPRTAIVHLGTQTMVFIDRGAAPDGRKRYERLPVAADENRAGEWVSVTHGLNPGELVVVKGTQSLSSGL